jgi:hypothetical protein
MPVKETATAEIDVASKSGSGAYADYVAEREEVLRHKWHMSEKAGRDVGFEAALLDWAEHHHGVWRKNRSK